jgi:hypothetical protein
MDPIKLLQNRNIQTTLFISIVCISLFQLLDMKYIVTIGVFILLIVYSSDMIQKTDTTPSIREDRKHDEISDDMYYNSKIHSLVTELKPFKKYNKVTYKEGVRYLRKFFKTIHILERDDISHYNPYFDNAHMYLKESINNFQSMAVSMPERNYNDGLKYNDFEVTKKTHVLGKICKELYNECYYILLNLSILFNERWSENPTHFTKEITFNADRIDDFDTRLDNHWSLV